MNIAPEGIVMDFIGGKQRKKSFGKVQHQHLQTGQTSDDIKIG